MLIDFEFVRGMYIIKKLQNYLIMKSLYSWTPGMCFGEILLPCNHKMLELEGDLVLNSNFAKREPKILRVEVIFPRSQSFLMVEE